MPRFNADLVDDLARRRVVLFVGAGASKWSKPHGGGRFKDWIEFLETANAKLDKRSRLRKVIAALIQERDYLLASELLKAQLGASWSDLLSSEFQQAADVSRLHKALVDLDQRLVITTNFDKLIESAWGAASGPLYPTVVTRIDADAFKLFRNDEKYLIKLHGSIDKPSEIIFDKTSYQIGAFGNSYYAEILSSLLLTHTFLFIGFSMADPAVSLVVESAAFRFPSARPHYIFQSGSPVPEVDELWKRLRRLYVMRYPDNNQHAALADQLEQLAREAAKRRAEIVAASRVVRP
jgi:hypothetical protein